MEPVLAWLNTHKKWIGIAALVIFILLGITFGTVPTFPE